MAEPVRKPAGWPELLATPEGVKAEVLDGVLMMSPRPAPRHNFIQIALAGLLFPPFGQAGGDGPGGWWFLMEPDIAFGPHDIVSPDLVGYRRERMATIPDSQPIELAPDWVCEVLSPSTARRDRLEKSELYLAGGVPHLWLIDPEARLLEAFAASASASGAAGERAWLRLGGWGDDDEAGIAPFDALSMPVGALFPPLAADSSEGADSGDADSEGPGSGQTAS